MERVYFYALQCYSPRFSTVKGESPIQYLHKKGILGPRTLLAHAIFVSDREIDYLASSRSRVAFCHLSSVRGSGAGTFSSLPDLVQRGVSVGLGTDSASSSYYQDPFRVMYLRSVMFQDGRRDRSLMPPETALGMAMVRAPQAVGLEDEIGSVEVGKRADLVILRTDGAEWTPGLYPPYHVVYSVDKSSVKTVIVNGRMVVKRSKLLAFDEKKYDVIVKNSPLTQSKGPSINQVTCGTLFRNSKVTQVGNRTCATG